MKEPFIVKYRPTLFSDFKMSSDLKLFLETSIMTNSLSLLLVGDPGSGKTTLLNIIIDTYYADSNITNDTKYSHILYINSLKEQGIQFYRNDVKTFCQIKSTIAGKKKIVVLDDIDFINEQSQQVFRNCMDKYSDNVNFLVSCINTQKVIESLQSRTTIVKLNPISDNYLEEIMNIIISKEKLNLDKEAKNLLISVTNGNVRLLINYLEKIMLLNKDITFDVMTKLCSNINHDTFAKYINMCRNRINLSDAINILYNLSDKGYSVMDLLDNLMFFIKKTDTLTESEKYNLLPIICKYIVIFHEIHEDNIELAVITNDIMTTLIENKNKLLCDVEI